VYLSGVGTLLHQKAVVFGRYDELAAVQQGGALQRQLQEAFAVDQRDKLLGQCFARKRPQTGAAAATQGDGNDGAAAGCSALCKTHGTNPLNDGQKG
jgi:hypothetical protein